MLRGLNHWLMAASGWLGGTNPATAAGRLMTESAKMIGITPAVFTRSGMWVLAPPYIRRPTIRFAYWTGIFRVAWVMAMTAAMTSTIIVSTNSIVNSDTVPARRLSTALMIVLGTRPMMLTKMMSEMPLPMPCSVIFSPSHMTKMVPVVWVTMVEKVNRNPGCGTIVSPCEAPRLVRNTL